MSYYPKHAAQDSDVPVAQSEERRIYNSTAGSSSLPGRTTSTPPDARQLAIEALETLLDAATDSSNISTHDGWHITAPRMELPKAVCAKVDTALAALRSEAPPVDATQLALETVGAWARRGIAIAADRWRDAEKDHGRGSPEEKWASGRFHDLVNFCLNIRGWVERPEDAVDGWCADLRATFPPGTSVAPPVDPALTAMEVAELVRAACIKAAKGEHSLPAPYPDHWERGYFDGRLGAAANIRRVDLRSLLADAAAGKKGGR